MHETRRGWLVVTLCGVLAALGCESGPDDPYDDNLSNASAPAPARPGGSRTGPEGAGEGRGDSDLRPALVVNGRPVSWEAVWEPMAEHAGGTVVAEIVLDSVLEQEMADRGVTIGPAAIEHERAALNRAIVEGVGVADQAAQQLIRRVTDARGLGPYRMERLLRRNAMLRELARESVVLDEGALRRAYEIEHGRRYLTRVITVATQREAADLRDRLLAGPPESLRSRFAEAAVEVSTDLTGSAGGMLGPISPEDTSLPATLRGAVRGAAPGTLSPVLAFDPSWALAYVESVVEPSGVAFEAVRPAIEPSLRDRMERLQMDVIAREMLAAARVSVFDRSLHWGWETGRPR